MSRQRTQAKVSVFPSILNPKFAWAEYETDMLRGSTTIPKKATEEAVVEMPSLELDLPDAKAVRRHEMMHVAFTHTVAPVMAKLRKEGITSDLVMQLTEDLRLGYLMNKKSLGPDSEAGTDDAVYTRNTLAGVVDMLLDAEASVIKAKTDGADDTTVSRLEIARDMAVASALISTSYQPISYPFDVDDASPLASEDADTSMALLREAAKVSYGDAGGEAIDAVFESGSRGKQAADVIVDTASREFEEAAGRQGSRRDGIREQRDVFERVARYVHATLESLVYRESPPPPPQPSQDGDKGGQGSSSGGASGDTGGKPSTSDQDNEGNAPKSADKGKDEPKDTSKDKTEKQSKKQSSEIIDNADKLAGKSLARAAADYLRAESRKAKKNGKREAATMMGGMPMPAVGGTGPGADSRLVCIEGLQLSLDHGPAIWKEMETVQPQLDRSYKVRVPRRGRPSLDGEIPRHWSRWFSDKAILDNRGRRPGGTLLIDVSGSMSWSHEKTMELINSVPAMTVALYSSNESQVGRMTIIARQGKAVPSDYPWRRMHGGGNGCDGPALSWLARQPGPRVWFSDGGVTGWGESMTPDLIDDATRLVKLGNIWRTTDYGDVKRIFSGQAPVSEKTSRDLGRAVSAVSIFTQIALADIKARM